VQPVNIMHSDYCIRACDDTDPQVLEGISLSIVMDLAEYIEWRISMLEV